MSHSDNLTLALLQQFYDLIK